MTKHDRGFAGMMRAVAAELLGEANPSLSTKAELRFGARGSLSVDLAKDCWSDHETGEGGGVLALIMRETGTDKAAALDWLRARGLQDAPQTRREVARYPYRDETGAHLFDVVRFDPKDFRQQAANGAWTIKGVRRVLYRLPELMAADPAQSVFIVEGEKDVDRLRALGLVATCNPGGAGKWHDGYSASLTGRRCILLPDNDQAGRDHADAVQRSLRGAAIAVARLDLDGLPNKGDVSDWLAAGGTVDDLRARAEAAVAADPGGNPEGGARVELVKGHTAEAATATIEVLRNDPAIFDFGGQLALADGGRVHPLCEHGLAHHLGTVAQFYRTTGEGDQADIDPPAALLKQIIAQGERRRLKPLDGVITGPTIRLDGSTLTAPGYDAATRLLFDPMGGPIPDVPFCPSMAQARAALDLLLQPFETFPFVDASARGALLAAILTAAVRAVLPTSPAFAFDAPIQGSGKTLLASCIGALIEGRAPDVWPHTQGRDDEETRKRLFTALRNGARALIWDNVTGTFDSASMAAFITASAMIDRVLGKSEALRIPNRAQLILTGNNLSLAGDLPRRVIICRIDPETDQPFARQFDLDPLAHVLQHRPAMLAAACILIRARFTHMTQPAPGRLASFEHWDDLVRQTVVWADAALRPGAFGDPMDLIREAQAADPEADALFALLDALRDTFGGREFTAKDAQAQARAGTTQGPLEMALLDLAGDRALASAKSLGRVLKNREGRIVHGLRMTGRQDRSGARFYRVVTIDTARPEKCGFEGYSGFLSSHTENSETRSIQRQYERAEKNPLNPSNPQTDPFDPNAGHWTGGRE